MKLFSLIILFSIELLSLQKVNAQPSSGDFLLGGSLSGYRNKFHYSNQKQLTSYINEAINFNPKIGFFINKHLALCVFTNITFYRSRSQKQLKDATQSSDIEKNKFNHIFLVWGGAIKYYNPIIDKIFWVNELLYERGYMARNISTATFISEETEPLQKHHFSSYTLKTGIHYFFKPHLSFKTDINALSLFAPNRHFYNLNILDPRSISIGINYLIKTEDE